jgi:rubrerythrin
MALSRVTHWLGPLLSHKESEAERHAVTFEPMDSQWAVEGDQSACYMCRVCGVLVFRSGSDG